MEYRVHTKDGKIYSYNEPGFGFAKFLIVFGIATSLLALGFYLQPGDPIMSKIPDKYLLFYSIFMFLAAMSGVHKLWYHNKWKNKTKIVQLKNGKFMVYQYMRYRTGCDWEFGDVFCDWGWQPYGCSDMVEEDEEIGLKGNPPSFYNIHEPRLLEKKIAELYNRREVEIMEKKMEEDGVIPVREVK